MQDIDYNELFGLTDEDLKSEEAETDEETEEETESEAESEESEEESEDTAEDTENFEEEGETEEESESEAESDDTEDSSDVKKNDSKKNSRFAAARRKAEQERDEAIAREKKRSEDAIAEIISSLGIKNDDGKLITTREELELHRASSEKKNAEEQLIRAGISRETIEKLISNHPAVLAAKEAEKKYSADMEAKNFEAELSEIGKLDPSIKSVEDLRDKPYYKNLYEKVQKGYSLIDAFKLSAETEIESRRVELTKKQAAINAKSKNHLRSPGSRGVKISSVPPDVVEQYRLFNPGMTDAQIASDYSKYEMQTKKK